MVIWVAVGGRKDPAAAIFGAIGLVVVVGPIAAVGELSLLVQGADFVAGHAGRAGWHRDYSGAAMTVLALASDGGPHSGGPIGP